MEFFLPRGILRVKHLSDELRQYIRRNGGGSGGASSGALADLSVTTGKLANGAVTTAKLADASVTTAKLADDAVTVAKIDPAISPAIHVRVACQTSVTLDGSDSTYDGETLATGDLILAFAQAPSVGHTHSPNNGVYVKTSSGMTRFTSDATEMRLVHVMEGTFAGMLFELHTDGSITVGTTDLAFARIDGAFHNITISRSDLSYVIPTGLGRVCIQITGGTAPTTAKTLTLPPATDYDGTEVWVLWEGGLGTGGSFAVVAPGSESVVGAASSYSGSRQVGIYIARAGDWYNV